MEVLGTGPETATWAIVGEAPGATEDREGVPFVGRSGQLLRKNLEKLGLDPADAFITNVVQVRPPNNATPTTKEIRAEVPRLAAELASLPNLKAVLLLGNTSLTAVTGKGGVTKRRGQLSDAKEAFPQHVSYFSTLHPAMVLRNNNYLPGWQEDLAAFQQIVRPPQEEVRTVLVDSLLKLPLLRQAVQPTGALDIETTIPGSEHGDHLICVGVTFDGETVYVIKPDLMEAAYPIIKDVGWTMHNGAYDRGWMLKYLGLDLKLEHDTMAMQYLLNSDERKGLQYLSSRYLGLPPYKDVNYDTILEEPFEKIALMNARDVSRTYHLFRVLADELNDSPQLSRLYQWILMPAVNTLVEVERTGVPVDRDNLEALTERLSVVEKILADSLIAKSGDPDFNPRSTQQVSKVLFSDRGLPILERTATGAPSTGSAVLKQLASDPFVEELLEHRKVSKQLSAFLNAWPEYITESGRIHPQFKPLRVVTGRLASAEPNIQQVPRDKDFRNVFGGEPGTLWIKADYSQIELRVAAWLAGEQTMIEAYRHGDDLHALTGLRVLGGEYEMAAANLLVVRAGLPTNRASTEILSTLWGGTFQGVEPEALLQLASAEWSYPEARSGLGWKPAEGAGASVLQKWDRYLQAATERELRALREHRALVRTSQGSQSVQQSTLQLADCVQILSCQGAPITPELRADLAAKRQVGKTLGFGLLYGAGANKLKEIAFQQYGLTMTKQEAWEYREGFFAAYPALANWHRDMARSITSTGKVVSPLGRVRHLPDALGWEDALVHRAIREGINHPVQGFASDLMLRAVNEIHARYPKYVVAIVHDEVDLVVPAEKVEEVSMFVKETMEDTSWLLRFGISLPVPVVADIEVGSHWGEVE